MLLTTIGNRAAHSLSTVVLMRFMGPGQFGIIGFAVIFKELVLLFSSWGIGDAVIQKKGGDHLIASGQILTFIRSGAFFLILFLAAPFAAEFFDTPEVNLVVRVSALMLLLAPLGFVPHLRLTVDLRFTVLAIVGFAGVLANSVVAVFAAMQGLGYLAIVYGNVAGSVVALVAVWVVKPSFVDPRKASREGMKEILGFGYNLTLSGIVAWVYLNVDDLIVGKLLGKGVLGLYTKAYWIATLPSETVGRILYNVTFPVYVRLKDDHDRLRRAFLEVYTMNVFVSLPAIVGILILSPKIVPIVFGQEWVPMITILEWTCVVGLLRAVYGQANSIFKAVGRPDYYWKAAAIQAIIVVTLGYWATTVWGVFGMLASLMIAMSWGFVVYGYLAFRKVLDIPLLPYLGTLRPIIISTIIMGIFCLALRPIAQGLFSLLAVMGTSACLYFGLVYSIGGRQLILDTIQTGRRVLGRD